MTSRTFSTLNANAIGPLLSLDLGNLVVKTNADALTADRKVLGTVPRGVGYAFFEFYAYSDSRPALGMDVNVVVGVSKPDSALDAAVGDDADSYGLVIGTGDIKNNGSPGATVNAQAERTCIGVYLNADPISPTLTFNTNGSFLAEVALPAGEFWVPAITVSGGTGTGDFKAFANFGQRGFDHPAITLADGSIVRSDGWYVENTEGIATIYLSIVDEGYTTRTADTPSAKAFRPRIRNPESFSIKRTASYWPFGGSLAFAAYGSLEIDNYDGAYDFLLAADLRDSRVILQLPRATMLAASHTLDALDAIATAILDNVSSTNEDIVTVSFKDTLARLDKPLPARFNAPFWDSNAANRMVPITLGACRNVEPQLIDQAGSGTGNPIYRLSDAQITNVAAVRDMGAPLDPDADPPQYRPALSGAGMELEVLPAGKLTVDISSEGSQIDIPPAVDVLGGVGTLTTWPVALSPPTGWAYGTMTGTISRVGTAQSYPQNYVAVLSTSSAAGQSMHTTADWLEGNKVYRISFNLVRWSGSLSLLQNLGFILTSSATVNPYGSISGFLTTPVFGDLTFTTIYKVPPGLPRKIYATLVGDPAYGAVNIGFYGLKVEELGEYTEFPLEGITYEHYFADVLKERASEDPSVWSAADLQAIDDDTGYVFGMHFDEQPNIARDALRTPLDSVCGDMNTDADGVIRTSRLRDPHDEDPIASFDQTNVDRPVSIEIDQAPNLTTVIGARRNWSPYGDSDFVSDQVTVPQDIRDRFKRQSQYLRTSSIIPAGQYANAIGAPLFDSVLDNVGLDGKPDDAQNEIDRVVSLYAPKVYSDGTIFNGKRRFVTFTARWDDQDSVGTDIVAAARDILIGSIVRLSYPGNGPVPKFDNTNLLVVGTELFPFGQKLVIKGWF